MTLPQNQRWKAKNVPPAVNVRLKKRFRRGRGERIYLVFQRTDKGWREIFYSTNEDNALRVLERTLLLGKFPPENRA
jgi:hypothetical protein